MMQWAEEKKQYSILSDINKIIQLFFLKPIKSQILKQFHNYWNYQDYTIQFWKACTRNSIFRSNVSVISTVLVFYARLLISTMTDIINNTPYISVPYMQGEQLLTMMPQVSRRSIRI